MDFDALEAMPDPSTKRDLMDRIAAARPALDDVIAPLTDADLAASRPGGWRVQDHLAHLATWERMLVAHLTDGNDHDVVGMTPPEYETADLETLNQRIYELCRDRHPADVRAEYHHAHAAAVSLIERLDDAELKRAYWSDDPSGRTVLEKLTGDTYRHYLEHRRWIMEALER